MKNDYYVYGHFLKTGDSLFYIGKGRLNRKTSSVGRSAEWFAITKDQEWYAKILHSGLTNEEALKLEKEIITTTPNIINKIISTKTKDIPNDILSYFEYDTSSPSFLRWRKPVIGVNGRVYQNVGDVAGIQKETSCGKNQRWIVRFLGNSFYAHRLVYALHYELVSDLVVDHIDGNALNNKIENLRAITQEMNSKNAKRGDTTTSTGVVGVSKVKRKRLNVTQYIAHWTEGDGKKRTKEFSNAKMTDEQAFQMACDFRANKIKELNEQGAGYTERHGT